MEKYKEISKTIRFVVGCLLAGFIVWLLFNRSTQAQSSSPGIEVLTYDSPITSEFGDNKIIVVKIDPQDYDFGLYSAKIEGEYQKSVEWWSIENDLMAVTNAGMFRDDYMTSMGYMQDYDFVNNETFVKGYQCLFVCNPKNDSVPPVQIIDMEYQDWQKIITHYNTVFQSIRMVDTFQKNRWSVQDKKWSVSCLGMDRERNVMMIFCRSPYPMHTFIDILLGLPIDLYNAMYLEGGAPASLYVDLGTSVIMEVGSYETHFNESDDNTEPWPIPNVIGITQK